MNENIFTNYRSWLTDQKMPNGKKSVLFAGLDLFAQQGYNGTSTAEIADNAGVSQATIFKYFKTKQDLLLAILQPIIENFFPLYRDDFLNQLNQFHSLPEVIRFMTVNRYHFLTENGDAFTILLSEFLTSETIRTLLFKIIGQSIPLISQELLTKLKQNGARPELDLTTLFRTLFGQIILYFLQNRFMPKLQSDEERDLTLIADQVIRAISV